MRPPGLNALRSALARSVSSLRYNSTVIAGVQLPTLQDLYLKPGDNGRSSPFRLTAVVVAMSGGVDSSVTLALLSSLDLNLSVLFMRNWDPLLSESRDEEPTFGLSYGSSDRLSPCEWEKDWADVQRVSAHMGIPSSAVKFVDLTKEYWSRVFEPSIAVWDAGRTPNPDVWCNKEIKFGALLEHIPKTHYLATGHYARVKRSPNATLHRALDMNKDQTYYLSQVQAAQLERAVFPLADIPKPKVRDLARAFELPTAERSESMGVCFVGERGKFGDFVSQYTAPPEPGYFVTLEGQRVAPHRGELYYTIGQRARVGGMDGRWFVARKGLDGNDILLVPGHDHPALQCVELECEEFTWIGDVPKGEERVLVQVRHRMKPVPGTVKVREAGVVISFDTPVAAVAGGQVAGLWRGTECLGSGVIEHTRCLQ